MSEYIGNLPSANPSPRIVGGVIKWYEGDTFDLQVDIELMDQNGDGVVILPEHALDFVFRNSRNEIVYAVRFTEITDNCVVLAFTPDVSSKFPKGGYTYDVYYDGAKRKTLVDQAPIIVE